jgi:hypothetical protein
MCVCVRACVSEGERERRGEHLGGVPIRLRVVRLRRPQDRPVVPLRRRAPALAPRRAHHRPAPRALPASRSTVTVAVAVHGQGHGHWKKKNAALAYRAVVHRTVCGMLTQSIHVMM